MFSSRFHWGARPNRLTALLGAKRASGATVLDLTQSNPTRAGLPCDEAAVRALANPHALRYDPSPAGLGPAREAVAAYYARRNVAVSADRILLTASTSEAYAYLFKLLANAGDEVLVPRPSYPLFDYLAAMESVTARSYPLAYQGGWWIDLEALERELTGRTRAIVVVNPNNPTGSYLKCAELAALSRLCRERELALISDEVFFDYALRADASRAPSAAADGDCLAFAMSGLSKTAGMPQMKLGWIVVSGPEPIRREAFERLEWIADTYLSVGAPVQCAAPELLQLGEAAQRRIRERTGRNLEWLQGAVSGTPAGVLDVEGGWCATLRVPRVRTEEEWTLELLDRHDVLLHPGFFFDFDSEAFLVASLLTEESVFREGVRRLLAMLEPAGR